MRLLVVGCGSIGSRRARLLAEMGHDVSVYDSDNQRAYDLSVSAALLTPTVLAGEPVTMGATISTSVAIGAGCNDAAFICTPAETHIQAALECLKAGIRGVFIEKPLAVSLDGIEELRKAAEGRTVMVACNMRFAYGDIVKRPYMAFESSRPLHEWRDGAVDAYAKNGIALESAIHEFDLAYATFGPIAELIEPRCDGDSLLVALRHENHSRSVVSADWGPSAVNVRRINAWRDHNQYPDTSDYMYRKEMQHFLDCVQNGTRPCNTIDDAAHVLEWALRAKEMAA